MSAPQTTTIEQLIAKWDSPDGHPYKGELIDWDAYRKNPTDIGCMCAQGQALHLLGGMSPEKIRTLTQSIADTETAKLLGISRAHAVLLRSINDSVDGAPAIVLTHPEKVIGDQAQTVLAFWRHLDRMTQKQWDAAWNAARAAAVYAARDVAWNVAGDAAWNAAGDVAGASARDVAWNAAGDVAGASARDVARASARDAVGAAAGDAARAAAVYANYEIQGAAIMRKNGVPFFFLPLFGFADPETVLAADEVA